MHDLVLVALVALPAVVGALLVLSGSVGPIGSRSRSA